MTETCGRAASMTTRGINTCRLLTLTSILATALAAQAAMPSHAVAAAPAFTTLYTFPNSAAGAMQLYGQGVIASGKVFYGVTPTGGLKFCDGGCGTVFSLAPTSNPNVWLR